MKHVKKVLAMVLVLCMVLTLVPSTVFAADTSENTDAVEEDEQMNDVANEKSEKKISEDSAEEEEIVIIEEDTLEVDEKSADSDVLSENSEIATTAVSKNRSVPLDTSKLYKIYHLDCGRKYFSVDQVKELIDVMAENDYNTLELAIGNDGLRFLLNDMSVEANGTTYSHEDVKAGIQKGNIAYYDAGTNEWTESEMNAIIAYAKGKGISIIPLVNTPGHMDAILTAATQVTGTDCSYNGSKRTIDVTNEIAVNFTLALVNKYIIYFKQQGCTIFNMGCDEYANDIYDNGSMGFGQLVSEGKYGSFITYVNNMAAQIQNAGMTPMAFNDGFYFNGVTDSGEFDTNIVVSFWSSGWSGYRSMSAADLASKGHKIINTNGDWYYILGKEYEKVNGVDVPHFGKVIERINSTPYNYVMGSGEMTVAGSMVCSWCDTPGSEYNDTEKSNFKAQISAFASANPSVFNVKSDEPKLEETVEVVAGGTKTIEIKGANYAGTYQPEDPSVATVEVTGKDAEESQPEYKQETVTCNDLISSDSTNWVLAEGYYYKVGDAYYPVYAKRSTGSFFGNTYYTYAWGYLQADSSQPRQIGNQQITSKTSDKVNPTIYKQTAGAMIPASTTIVVSAASDAAGKTTKVTIGDTIYTINVVTEDISNASDLTLEYWITNGRPTDNKGNSAITLKAIDANSEDGIGVTEIAPEKTTKETRTLQYWRCRLLNKNQNNNSTSGKEEQTEDAGDDETYNGLAFTKVRYWNGSWSVYTENNEWVNVSLNHQLVAYYLEILPVADELTVTAADWGKKGDGTTSGDYLEPANSCTVSVQVVYPDGTTNPIDTTAENLKSRTIAYGYWSSGRGIGTLNLKGLEGYQIWKISAETGEESYANSSSTWGSYTVSNFSWDNNPMTVYEGDPVDSYVIHNDAHNPSNDGYYQNLMWDENYEAILIKVYIKAKPTDDTLKVVYHDEKFGTDLYSYDINVTNGVDFGAITPEPPAFTGNMDRIDVTGCGIENNLGVEQKFQTDLIKVPEAVGKYNSELYKYTGSVISKDKKTLYLYYTINTDVLSPMFVIDYGRSFTFDLTDVVKSGIDTVKSVSVGEKTKYGSLSYDGNTKKFTYTPTQVLTNIDVLTINITFDGQEVVTTNSGVMPATTVNYEEGFAELDGFTNGANGDTYQTKQIAGQSSDNYGYDGNVLAEMNNAASASAKGSKASFSFTGTGVDLYVNSTATSGNIVAQVRNKDNRLVKVVSVKTTSHSTITGEYSDTNQNELIAASIRGLEHGEYSVKIATAGDETVYFDGFRVYGTVADQENEYYTNDHEDAPTFLELRDYVLTAMDIDNNTSSADVYAQVREKTDGQLTGVVLITKDNPSYSAEDLLKNGPKNELFLLPGESVIFNIDTNREVQLGMKAVNGSVNVGGTYNGQITTDKDMFYTVKNASESSNDAVITITNEETSSSILSITKVKICDDPNAVFAELGEDDFTDALVSLGVAEEEKPIVKADAVVNVNLVDYTDKVLVATSLTASGEEGTEAVIAGADIKAAVEQLLPEGYAFVDESAIKDQTVICGESADVSVQIGKVAVLKVTYKTLLGKKVGTATLTAVQDSAASSYTFSASELRKTAPGGYWTGTFIPTKVSYGSTGTRTVIGF